MLGYQGRVLPRMLRRLFVRSDLHRAWLCGFHGRFEEDGLLYGPAWPYRPVFTSRYGIMPFSKGEGRLWEVQKLIKEKDRENLDNPNR